MLRIRKNPWIIKPGEEMDVTIHGFSPEKEIQLGLITQLCETVNGMPEKIKNNFPYKVREKLKKYPDWNWRRWYVEAQLYIYTQPCFFYKDKSVKSGEYAQFRKAVSSLRTLPAGENAILAAVIGKEEEEAGILLLKRYIPESAVAECAGETIALFPAGKVAEQLTLWKKRILCYKFGLRVSIGRDDCSANAIWWINYETKTGTVSNNILGSIDGKWQVLPRKDGFAKVLFSLDEAIKEINNLAAIE